MAKLAIKDLLKELTRLEQRKRPWLDKWQDCYDYGFPHRESLFGATNGEQRTEKIFDSTAVNAIQDFASLIKTSMMPEFSKWVEFKPGLLTGTRTQTRDLEKSFSELTDLFFSVISLSNFDNQIHEALQEVAIGTGAIIINPGDTLSPIFTQAVPLTELLIGIGPLGVVDRQFRARKIHVDRLKKLWPNGEFGEEIEKMISEGRDKEIPIFEGTMRDYDDVGTETWNYYVCSPNPKQMILQDTFKGFGSNPFIVFRWAVSGNEFYGRGPFLSVLPDVKTLNLMVELMLENADFAAAGAWMADDDGVINVDVVEIRARTIIPIAPDSRGIQPLQPPGDFQISERLVENLQRSIRRGMFDDSVELAQQGKTPPSVQQLLMRQADLARRIGPGFGRLNSEAIRPIARRIIHIMMRTGMIGEVRLDGQQGLIQPVSPLAKQQQAEQVNSLTSLLELTNAFFGPEVTNLMVDQEKALPWLADRLGVPDTLLRSTTQMRALAEQVAQAAQQPGVAETLSNGAQTAQFPRAV